MVDAHTRGHGALEALVVEIARDVRRAGGRALLVGGWVRDRFLNPGGAAAAPQVPDADVEVFGLTLVDLETLLSRHGEVIAVGRAFGVLRLKGIDVDFSLPRRDSKVTPGHRGFDVQCDPDLDFATAALRRDLTINSMALDPLTGELLDPHGGRADLAAGVLRATDPAHFPEDPLRALRVARFAGRFEMVADETVVALCRDLDLAELSPERIFGEFVKLLVRGRRPSLGLEFLARTGLIRFFPELARLIGAVQEPEWHPEGDVWVHTLMVVDQAAGLRRGDGDDAALMFGALCHDLGKPETTVERDGRIRSPGHDVRGVACATAFLNSLRAPGRLVTRVAMLVRHHLAPGAFVRNGATARAYRRLARQCAAAGVSLDLLLRVSRADSLGRTTPDALAGAHPAGDLFAARAAKLLVDRAGPTDVVLGRHLIARGLTPGPAFGPLLARCRQVQDETGSSDPEEILDRVLASGTGTV
ncbi:MAG: CCA tRNA nucleotidyltransferase [Acidobacteriota bacterium]